MKINPDSERAKKGKPLKKTHPGGEGNNSNKNESSSMRREATLDLGKKRGGLSPRE